MKNTKRALLHSIIALLLCVAQLLGTTFAWFTDSVTSTQNIIKSGNLDLEMYWTDDLDGGVWYDVEDDAHNTIFGYDNWEPGYTEVRYIKIINKGDLAFNYDVTLAPKGVVGKLAEVINVYFMEDVEKNIETREELLGYASAGPLSTVMNGGKVAHGTLLPAGETDPAHKTESTVLAIGMTMLTTAGNDYQNETVGDFTIKALATQLTYEKDSFGEDYDKDAAPVVVGPSTGSVAVNGTLPTEGVTIDAGNGVSASVPGDVVLESGADKLTLSVYPKDKSDSNITVDSGEHLTALDVHIEGVADTNTKPITVELGKVLPEGLNMGNYTLAHVENGVTNPMTYVAAGDPFTAHNQFKYDPATGNVTIYIATFSEIAVVSDIENAWEGNFDYSWYTNAVAVAAADGEPDYVIANADQLAAFGAIVGGMDGQTQDSFKDKTVKLVADINLGDKESENNPDLIFYPIGYYNNAGNYEKTSGGSVTSSVSSFEGTFDGNGNKIANFYQNTWEMFGDYNSGYSGTPNHYCDAMGLFGYVLNGTVKNLTVENFSSDGEFTPTGVIAAYADGDSTFENIAITNCNPRVYNTGNGGIIGIAGDTSEVNDDHITLKNITVDNSNKISALWGSYDVACGGLVGMYRGNVDGSGNATDDTISFENCHVSAIMDVYNDVCGNYQYYAYRYAGMIIGSVRHNTKNDEGKTIPNMTGISATGCTVNYGDWNDYYYCEFEKNGHPSYSGPDDYKFSRVDKSEITFDEEGNITGCTHNHTAAENNKAIYLPFHQLFTGYGWGVNSIGLEKYGGIVTNLDITEGDQQESVEKFETKFTGDFLYRVGNQNTVSLGSLFKAKDGVKIANGGVWVTIEKVDENSNVSGVFTFDPKTSNWENATIKFSGTGVVKVTIQDYNFCTPTELRLEVVDAVNATTATSATANNVVLLNDCGFSSLEVSGGYTLYGNGFTMTCGSDSAALDMGYSFVKLENGTLDNVQIVCPNFDYAALYKSNLTSSDNRSETTDKTRYYNAKSGVMVSGNSQILNSRVSGGRAAVNVSGGNVVIDNSRIELGAVASVLVGAANSVTLRDVTLVQKPAASTYDPNKTLMGFSVLYLCDSEGKATPTTLEGSFVQQAWVNADDKQYVPSAGQDIVDGVMKETAFIHNIDGKDSLNLGFAYMPEDAQKTVAAPDNITDNRTDKATIPYEMKDVKIQIAILSTTVYVYSYKNTNGTADSFKTESEYVPNKYSDIITVSYSDTADGLTTGKSFGTDGWVYELNVDLDKLSGYALDFSKLSMSVNGVEVTDFKVNGNAKPTSPVAVAAGGTTYTLTATIDGKEYTATYKVTGTETSKESPSLVGTPSYGAGFGVANKYGGDWSAAAPVLDGITVKYWSVADSEYKEFALSSITFANTGKQNGTNNYWEYTHTNNDFTLKLTNTAVIHSSSGTYGMPVAGKDGKLYFTIASSGGFVSTGTTSRAITIAYEFTDNNGGDTLKFSHTWNIPYSKDEQYNYSSFTSDGTLTKLEAGSSSGGGCVTPDTLVTLADGTQKRIDAITYEDELLVWDFYKGEYAIVPSALIVNHGYGEQTVIELTFDDGVSVKVITAHAFFDTDTNSWEMINSDNANEYIGHSFVKSSDNGYTQSKLVDVAVYNDYTESYSLVSAVHYNFITNDYFSLTNSVYNMLAGLVVGDNMTYDAVTLKNDIEKYGCYTYSDFEKHISYEQYVAFNGDFLKISVEKGNCTYEYILNLIDEYLK